MATHLGMLPREVWIFGILPVLTLREVCVLSLTSKFFLRLANEEDVWLQMCMRLFQFLPQSRGTAKELILSRFCSNIAFQLNVSPFKRTVIWEVSKFRNMFQNRPSLCMNSEVFSVKLQRWNKNQCNFGTFQLEIKEQFSKTIHHGTWQYDFLSVHLRAEVSVQIPEYPDDMEDPITNMVDWSSTLKCVYKLENLNQAEMSPCSFAFGNYLGTGLGTVPQLLHEEVHACEVFFDRDLEDVFSIEEIKMCLQCGQRGHFNKGCPYVEASKSKRVNCKRGRNKKVWKPVKR